MKDLRFEVELENLCTELGALEEKYLKRLAYLRSISDREDYAGEDCIAYIKSRLSRLSSCVDVENL